MKRSIILGIVLGVVVIAILSVALVLDLVSGPEARDAAVKAILVIGIVVAAMIIIGVLSKLGNNN